MRRALTILVVLVLIGGAIAYQRLDREAARETRATNVDSPSLEAEQATNDDERQAVLDAFNGLLGASEAGDVDGYLSYITDDAVMMYNEMPAVVGREAVRPFVSEFFRQYRFELSPWQSEEIQIEGSWAFHRYSGIAVITAKNGGDSVREDRKYIDILRNVGGAWKTSHHIYNVNE